MHKRSKAMVRKAVTSMILRHFTILVYYRNLSTTEERAQVTPEILWLQFTLSGLKATFVSRGHVYKHAKPTINKVLTR